MLDKAITLLKSLLKIIEGFFPMNMIFKYFGLLKHEDELSFLKQYGN